MEVLFIVFGIIGGLLGGMGMGGGTLLIPLLTLGLDVPQQTAQLLNLLTFIPMSAFALIVHAKKRIRRKETYLFSLFCLRWRLRFWAAFSQRKYLPKF